MARILVSIPDQKLRKLDALARRCRKSRAQLVREAVQLYLKSAAERKENWKELRSDWQQLFKAARAIERKVGPVIPPEK